MIGQRLTVIAQAEPENRRNTDDYRRCHDADL